MPEEERYQIVISNQARRALKKIPLRIRQQIDSKILALSGNPRPLRVKALQGEKGLLRLRVGEYRVIYTVKDEQLIIVIIQVGHRREIYRKL